MVGSSGSAHVSALLWGVLIAALAVVLAILLIFRLTRSITRPNQSSLRRLRQEAALKRETCPHKRHSHL